MLSGQNSNHRLETTINKPLVMFFRSRLDLGYAAPIGAFFCPEIRAFSETSSTVSKVLSDRKVQIKHKIAVNGAVNSR